MLVDQLGFSSGSLRLVSEKSSRYYHYYDFPFFSPNFYFYSRIWRKSKYEKSCSVKSSWRRRVIFRKSRKRPFLARWNIRIRWQLNQARITRWSVRCRRRYFTNSLYRRITGSISSELLNYIFRWARICDEQVNTTNPSSILKTKLLISQLPTRIQCVSLI